VVARGGLGILEGVEILTAMLLINSYYSSSDARPDLHGIG